MKEHIAPQTRKRSPRDSLKKQPGKLNLPSLLDKLAATGVMILFAIILTRVPYYFFQPADKNRIEIQGNRLLSREKIIDYLDISADVNWVALDPYVLASRLKNRLWIEKVMVRRYFPLGLQVHVHEEKPAAYLKTGKRLHFITENHLVLNIPSSTEGWDLPVIVDDKLGEIKPGDKLPASRFRGARQLTEALKEVRFISPDAISEIIITDPLNIQAALIPYGIKIKFGFKNFKEKLANLYHAMPEINRNKTKIEFIDLRHPRGVVIKKSKTRLRDGRASMRFHSFFHSRDRFLGQRQNILRNQPLTVLSESSPKIFNHIDR